MLEQRWLQYLAVQRPWLYKWVFDWMEGQEMLRAFQGEVSLIDLLADLIQGLSSMAVCGRPWQRPAEHIRLTGARYMGACRAFQPDVIHCSSPGVMWLAALVYSRLLKKPLVYSYHTHVPEYMPRYACYDNCMHAG